MGRNLLPLIVALLAGCTPQGRLDSGLAASEVTGGTCQVQSEQDWECRDLEGSHPAADQVNEALKRIDTRLEQATHAGREALGD